MGIVLLFLFGISFLTAPTFNLHGERARELFPQVFHTFATSLFSGILYAESGDVMGKVEYKKISEVADYVRGRGLSKADKQANGEKIILYGELYTIYGSYITEIASRATAAAVAESVKISANTVLMPITSTTKEAKIGKASVLKVPIYLGSDAIAIIPSRELNPSFLMYLLNGSNFERLKMRHVNGTTIRHLSPDGIMDIKIPIPSLSIQQEIAGILDNFTKLEAELAAEQEARKRQFAYYRDLLISFPS